MKYRHGSPSLQTVTTGLRYFAECHRHSAKAEKHSANCWPSVALGKAHTAFLLPAKPALPSAFSRALGKPLPCAKPHSAKKLETGRTDSWTGERDGELANGTAERDGSKTLPSARCSALGKDSNFAECQAGRTRRSLDICRVSGVWHSAKFGSLPSASRLTLGEVSNFAECQGNYTRQIRFPGNRKMIALPSVRVKTLGKLLLFFYMFSVFMYSPHSSSQKKHIYIPDKRYIYMAHPSHNNTNISRCVAWISQIA